MKIMKNIKFYILSIVAMMMSVSCEKALDINTDPLVATTADANVVLPFVIVQYSNRHTTELGTRIMDVSQHLSANFNSPRNGSTSIFLTGNTWGMMYTQVLGNLLLVEQDAIDAGESSNNVAAIAMILKGQIFYELSSIWEKVPFSEALDGVQYPSPAFDTQQQVFEGVLTILDEAVALIDAMPAEGIFDVSVGDLIYHGDMDNWKRYANSLKLRVLMLLRNGDGGTTYDAQIISTLGASLIDDNSQVPMIRYTTAAGGINGFQGLNEAFFGTSNESTEVYAPGEHTYSLIKNNALDPRNELLLYDPNDESPVNGLFASSTQAVLSDNVIRRDLPHVLYLPAEISFYRAELALKGVATGDNAQTEFGNGITQILQWWGQDIPGAVVTISDADITAYIGSLPAVDLNAVYEQEYLETFLRPVVAWNHVRRTGIPALSPPSATSITTILKRFNYPPDEVAANPNTPVNERTDLPMWFENL